MKAVEQQQAKSRFAFALRHPLGPKAKEASARLTNLPAGAPVLVYRIHEKKWTGQHKFINVERETVDVQLPHGRRIFRSSHVKPWIDSKLDPVIGARNKTATQKDTDYQEMPDDEEETVGAAEDDTISLVEGENTPKKFTGKYDRDPFRNGRKRELRGLVENGTFIPTARENVPK